MDFIHSYVLHIIYMPSVSYISYVSVFNPVVLMDESQRIWRQILSQISPSKDG